MPFPADGGLLVAQSAASGATPDLLAHWYATARHIPAPAPDAPPPAFVARTRATLVADGDDLHRFVRRYWGEEHRALTLSLQAARVITQLRSPAPLIRQPVRLNPPEGRAVTSLDTVRKILHRAAADPRNHPLRKNEKPSKNNPFRSPEARDAADAAVRIDLVAELRRQGYQREADRVEKCGTVIGVRSCCSCGHRQAVQTRCDLWQMCPTCCRRRGRQMAAELLRHKERVPKVKGFRWRMLTLPVKNTGDAAADVRRLSQAFAKLWRVNLKRPGAAAFRAIEFGALTGNVHLHAVYYGPWIGQAELSERWHQLTGDSYVVDVRAIEGNRRGISEVAKYAVKLFAVPADRAIDFWQAIRGKQTTQRYGALRGLRSENPADEFEIDCELCGGTEYHYTAVAPDDADALRHLLHGRSPP